MDKKDGQDCFYYLDPLPATGISVEPFNATYALLRAFADRAPDRAGAPAGANAAGGARVHIK